MNKSKGERRAFPAKIPIESLRQLEELSEQTGKYLNDVLIEAVDFFLESKRGELTPSQPDITLPQPDIKLNQPDITLEQTEIRLGSDPPQTDIRLDFQPSNRDQLGATAEQTDIRLGAGKNLPTQEEALAYAQLLLEQKRQRPPSAPMPASEAISALAKRGLFQRLLCSEDGCDQGAARSVDRKNYCAHHASLKEYAKLPPPAEPPVSRVTLPDCDICQKRRFLVVERDGKLSAHRCLGCLVECWECEKGLVLWTDSQNYEKWLPCGCRKAPIERQLLAIAGADFPGAFAELLFGKLPPIEMSDSQKEAHLLSWNWAKNFTFKEKSGFFFYGSPGTGKSLSLCRAMALLLQRESTQRVRYLHFPAWLDLKKQSFGSEDQMECASELVAPDVLLVDEILLQGRSGAVRSFTEWERSQFDLMVHNRWLAGKPTLYATNYKPEQVEAEVSESTWSRIRSASLFFEVSGKDMRLTNNVIPFRPRGAK